MWSTRARSRVEIGHTQIAENIVEGNDKLYMS